MASNVLDRHFWPERANTAWVSDITYIRTRSGWLYLAAVMDLYSRRIVGWAMAAAITLFSLMSSFLHSTPFSDHAMPRAEQELQQKALSHQAKV